MANIRIADAERETDRERIKGRLTQLGLSFMDVKRGSSYGFPTYIVVFDSVEKSRAFPKSQAFEAMLEELRTMHAHIGDATNRFDPSKAVGVEPYEW